MADEDPTHSHGDGESHGDPRTDPDIDTWRGSADDDHSHEPRHTGDHDHATGAHDGPDGGGPHARHDDPESTFAEDSLRALVESEAVPTEGGDPVFASPWQARAFGLAVAMRAQGGPVEWQSFQELLAAEIETAPGSDDPETLEDDYYRRWLSALERLLVDEGYLTEERLRHRAAEFADGDRTAAEFVEGHHEH